MIVWTQHHSVICSCLTMKLKYLPPADSTGTHSLYTTYQGYEVMFHVSTMLPYMPNNPQQVRAHKATFWCLQLQNTSTTFLSFNPKSVCGCWLKALLFAPGHKPTARIHRVETRDLCRPLHLEFIQPLMFFIVFVLVCPLLLTGLSFFNWITAGWGSVQ